MHADCGPEGITFQANVFVGPLISGFWGLQQVWRPHRALHLPDAGLLLPFYGEVFIPRRAA